MGAKGRAKLLIREQKRKGKKRVLIAAYDTLKRRNVVTLKLGNEQTNEQPYRMKRKHRVIALLGKQEASGHATRGSGNSSNRGLKFSVRKETEKIYRLYAYEILNDASFVR